MPKLLGISASPRKGATEYVVQTALEAAAEMEGIETEYMSFRGKEIKPCIQCDYCRREKTYCNKQDDMQQMLEQLVAADAYFIASPVYVMGPTPQLAAFFSRLRPLHHVFPGSLRNKIGGAAAVGGTRNGGQELTVNIILNYMITRGLTVTGGEVGDYAGGKIWSKDRKAEGAAEDVEGMATAIRTAKRVAELSLLLKKGVNN